MTHTLSLIQNIHPRDYANGASVDFHRLKLYKYVEKTKKKQNNT